MSETKPPAKKFIVRHGEQWKDGGHSNTRKTGRVTAVRVAAGDPSRRGGQFHGATNYPEINC